MKPKPQLSVAPCPSFLDGDQKLIWDYFEKMKTTCIKKNMDYGSSVFKQPVLAPNLPVPTAILVRMSDKIQRLSNLLEREDQSLVQDEACTDTMVDLAAYAVLFLIAQKKQDEESRTLRPVSKS